MSKQTTLIDRLQEQVNQEPLKAAFTFLADGDTEIDRLTYQELQSKAQAIAVVLQRHQAQGERALLLYQPGLEFITAFLGCLYAGVVAVPVYPPRANRSLKRLLAIVADAQAKFALTTDLIQEQVAERFTQHEATKNIQFIATDTFALGLAQEWEYPDISLDSLAFLQYTSGSTGNPKGVMVSHGNLMANSATINAGFQNNREHTAIAWLPPYHDMGLIGCIIQPMYVGLSMYLMAPVTFLQRPYRWLKAISKYRGVTNGGPNFAYDLCVEKITPEQKATLDLSCWELAFSGAEPVRAETIERFSKYFAECGFQASAFYPCYGMAESTLMITGGNKQQPATSCQFDRQQLAENYAKKPSAPELGITLVSSGNNVAQQDLVIADPETLNSCPEEVVGEIWSKSPSVAQGYWNRPKLTQHSFNGTLADTGEPGWLRTGDLGFLKDGELYVTGRLKDLIIIHGRNYYPQDIELTVDQAHIAIRAGNVAAFAVEQSGREQLIVVAEIKRTYLRKLEPGAVIKAVCRAIAEQHELQTQAVILIKTGSIPKTSSGKIQRHACKSGYQNDSLNVVGSSHNHPPQSVLRQTANSGRLIPGSDRSSQIRHWLIERLAQRLGVTPSTIDPTEPFASSGLSSVEAVGLSADLEDWLQIKLAPTIVFDYPNILELSNYLANETSSQPPSKLEQTNAHVAIPRDNNAEIAIIGMGCRFPGANNPQEFWELLAQGQDSIRKSERWSEPSYGGFIEGVDQFDPQFFGITPREAQSIDPQQRILLEVSWHALEDAAITNEELAGSNTGVFMGLSSSDYTQLRWHYGVAVDAYAGTGNAHSIAANRLSYLLDLKGPSLAVDTACSSSLVALHLACQSLRSGDCHQAIAGGVNLILSPELTKTFELAGMMAADGHCKTFDAEADGYVRGEGCGVIVLKRLEDAKQDGDHILAIIKGSAINQDGKSNGLTAPNGLAQQKVIRQALANAGLTATDISYVESHGTGTSLGDPIEVNSLKAVLGDDDQDCFLGSLKTNIGHLEAAAGIAGLIKTVLCLQHRIIPPNLHFKELNPLIDLAGSGLKIPSSLQSWDRKSTRYAGVSSFGFGGTNSHVILAEGQESSRESQQQTVNPPQILTLSAKTASGLDHLVQRYQKHLVEHPELKLSDICFTSSTGRQHFQHRLAIWVDSYEQLQQQLADFSNGQSTITAGQAKSQNRVAFLFTGQGSQYVDMGRQLYQTQPIFRRALDDCAAILESYLDQKLLNILYPESASSQASDSLLNQTIYTQPAIFALEYALAQMWLDWGVEPHALIGHSVGEYVAATIAGVFSLEDALKLVATRGQLMQSLAPGGEMYAIFASEAEIQQLIAPWQSQLAIAAINTAQSLVISGAKAAIREVISKLDSQGVKIKQLQVSHAFHSPLMEPILEKFRQVAATVTYHVPQMPLISNVSGNLADNSITTPDYWVNHVVAPVCFAAGMRTLQQQNCNLFLEIGSKPILLGLGRPSIDGKEAETKWLPSLRPRKQDWEQVAQSLINLYVSGVPVNWVNFARGYQGRKVKLPLYPFQRASYWLTPGEGSTVQPQVYIPGKLNLPDFYQIAWQEYDCSAQTLPEKSDRPWLIFAEHSELAQTIVATLEGRGQDYLLVETQHLDASSLTQLFQDNSQWHSIVYLAGLNTPQGSDYLEFATYQQQHCTNILNLVQALYQNVAKGLIWLVTQDHHQRGKVLDSSVVVTSCLWGLASAIAIEHPEYWGGIVDLNSSVEPETASTLLKIINHQGSEEGWILDKNKVFVSRLQKRALSANSSSIQISSEGDYLITGGLGALGLQLAQWLSAQGAQNLILLGRSAPDAEASKVVAEIESQGVRVQVIQADITDQHALDKALAPELANLKGVIHAAGLLDDGLLQDQTWPRFSRVIAPKVQGAWNLHQLTQDLQLDFWVLFSSVASLIGSPGQSNYSVANNGLDAIARYRRSLGLPALSINWGAWGGSGMAVEQGFALSGLDLIEPDAGFTALEQLLNSQETQVGVLKADWDKLSQKLPFVRESSYFAELVEQKAHQSVAPGLILKQILALEPTQRPEFLVQYLRQAIANILQIEAGNLDVNTSLLETGMDSLMVMEAINQLKSDLELILYPREFYEHPQIASLANYLAAELAKTHRTQVKSAPTEETVPPRKQLTTKLPPAAFILSSPRSGSTLLRVMLAGHPGVASPPELHLLPFETMQQREQELGLSQLGEGLKRAFMELKGIDAEASQALVQELVAQDSSVEEVYRQLQKLAGDRLLLDKSPTYASERNTLDQAEAIFAGAKYIHLVRHPYAVVESFTRMRMDKLVGSGDSDPFAMAELIWRNSNQNVLDFAADLDPERYHLVYYEELVRHPRQIMTQVCEFLEIPFDEAVLTPYQGERMTDGVTDSAMSLGDPNFLNHQKIDSHLGETWREIQLPTRLGTYSQQLARQLKYELPQENGREADVVDHLMEETLITIRGLKICLCTWGPEEGPLVLCLHGILEQGAAWSEVAIRLAQKGYRVIAPDLRGHGRSDRVGKGGSYNLIDFLGDIDAIVENLTGRAVILVGHSLGSVLGAIFATIRPQRIKNIVLVETILPTANEDEDPSVTFANQLDNMAAPPEHPVFPDIKTAAERLRKATPAISPALAMLLAERITEPCPGGVRWRWEPLLRTRAGISLNGIGRSRYLQLLRKIKVPITLVYGDKSNFNRLEDLNKQQEAMPNATKVVVSGGHNLPLEAPSALAKIISGAVALTNKLIP